MHTQTSEETRQQMEQLITDMVNRWLHLKMAEHDYDPAMIPDEANKFFNLPLRTVYNLLLNDFLVNPPAEQPPFLEKGTVIEYMKEATRVRETEALAKYRDGRPSLPDDIIDKTSVRKWIHEQDYVQPPMSTKLFNILDRNEENWECIEYIDKKSFLKCSNAGEHAWQEFVTRRGY